MKLNPHSKYLRFIFIFLLIVWGIIGFFDFVNYCFDLNKPLVANQPDIRLNSLNLLGNELPEKTKDEIRILALGDSVTMGLGIFFKEDWPSRMEKELRKMGVAATAMNAGKHGFLNRQIYEAYKELLDKNIKPDLIVYYGSGNILGLYDIKESYFEDIDLKLKKIFPNFPNDLEVQEIFSIQEAADDNNSLILPQFIKSQSYYSSFFGLVVKKKNGISKSEKTIQ